MARTQIGVDGDGLAPNVTLFRANLRSGEGFQDFVTSPLRIEERWFPPPLNEQIINKILLQLEKLDDEYLQDKRNDGTSHRSREKKKTLHTFTTHKTS